MKEKNNNRTKWLPLRLTPSEYEQIQKQFSKTTDRKLSEYARRKLLGKPVTINCRNQSLDAYMEELVQLKTQLSAVGNNFNQAVRKLHTLSKIKEFEQWLASYELDKRQLLNHIGQINDHLKKLADTWLQ